MRNVCEAACVLAILFCIVITLGEPDVLDGWIKRANDVECHRMGERDGR